MVGILISLVIVLVLFNLKKIIKYVVIGAIAVTSALQGITAFLDFFF